MLARVWVHLPYAFHRLPDDSLQPIRFRTGPTFASVYPPIQSISDEPSNDLVNGVPTHLLPAKDLRLTEMVRINGRATLAVNLLQIDFHAKRFNRREGGSPFQVEPSIDRITLAANRILLRYRSLLYAPQVTPISFPWFSFAIHYLKDDEGEFARRNGLLRWRVGRSQPTAASASITEEIWEPIRTSPTDYDDQQPWHLLLVEAIGLPPTALGSKITLAQTALEVRASEALNVLARKRRIRAPIWRMLMEPDDPMKAPSLTDQLDTLLKVLGGRSLKEDGQLWESFRQLRRARNTFTHEARLMLGKRPMTEADANQLLNAVVRIIAFIDALLPDKDRRLVPRVTAELTITGPAVRIR